MRIDSAAIQLLRLALYVDYAHVVFVSQPCVLIKVFKYQFTGGSIMPVKPPLNDEIKIGSYFVNKKNIKALCLVNEDKNIVIDLINGIFTISSLEQSQAIKIGVREVNVLRYLVNRNGYLVTKDDILKNCWNGRIVCENAVSVALSNLRKILRRVDRDCHCLVTVARVGYIFYPHRSGLTIEYENHEKHW